MPMYNEKGALVVTSGFGDRITDLDGDTYVIAAEEYIDFFADGTRYQRIDANGVQVTEYIAHYDDLDTYLRFQPDLLNIYVGGINFLEIFEGAGSYVKWNSGGGDDVDFQWDTLGGVGSLFIQGSDGNVGIGTNTFGANSAIVLGFTNAATNPTNSVDLMHIYCVDRAVDNAQFACYQESAILVEVDEGKMSHKWPVRLNGVDYFIMLCQT